MHGGQPLNVGFALRQASEIGLKCPPQDLPAFTKPVDMHGGDALDFRLALREAVQIGF